MLNDEFLAGLRAAFPEFYERVNEDAARDAARLRAAANGNVPRALARARLEGAGAVWWPYVKGSMPFVGNERPAMETFTRLVLTVDHIVGWQPPSMDAARDQVIAVLANTLDTERVKKLLHRDSAAGGAAAAGATGIMASATAFLQPFQTLRKVRRAMRFVPAPVRIAIGVAVVATIASIPLVAGFSAGAHAERSARNFGEPPSQTKS